MIDKNMNLPDKDEVLENEDMLLRGLMEAGNYKNDEAFQRKIEIKRGERVLYSFTVRPLSEEEELSCLHSATQQIPNPAGRKYGTIDGRTDSGKFRSLKIYTATIDADRQRIWDNQVYRKQLGAMTAVDMIDKVLRTGDKDKVIAIINEISGGTVDNDAVQAEGEEASLEDWAKN